MIHLPLAGCRCWPAHHTKHEGIHDRWVCCAFVSLCLCLWDFWARCSHWRCCMKESLCPGCSGCNEEKWPSEPTIKIEVGRTAHSPKSPHTYSKLCPTTFTGDFSRLREHWGIPAGHCSSARPGIWKCSVTVPEPCGVKQKYIQNSGQTQQVILSEGNTPNTPMGLQLQYFLT